MSVWYYAGADRQQRGPLPSEDLARLFHQGAIRLDTLIWREGQAEWQPLRDFSDELALHQPGNEHFYAPTDLTPPAPADDGATTSAPELSPYAPPVAPVYASATIVHDGNVVHAGFWKRFAAAILDGIVLTVVLLIILGVGFGVMGGMGIFSGTQTSDAAAGMVGLFLIVGVYIVPIFMQAAYYSWMHASGAQATLGKMAVGIKVARSDGTALGLGRSFGRWAAYFFFNLASCGIATLVSAFMVGLTQRKQGLHDMVADTLVVDKWAFTAHPERQRHELGGVTIAIIVLGALLAIGYFVLLIFAGFMSSQF